MGKCRFFVESCGVCRILINTKCTENCKFRKTNDEFYEGIRHAEDILRRKGLVACKVSNLDGEEIMTTRKAR